MYKIIIFAAALFFAAMPLLAQSETTAPTDTTNARVLKAQSGDVATELNVNPFNGGLSLNNSLNQVKFRYFISPEWAVRLGINASRVFHRIDNNSPYGTNTYRFKDERKITTMGLNLGIEKHFAGTRRLSPYVAADLVVMNKHTEQNLIESSNEVNIKGIWYNRTYSSNPPYGAYEIEEAGFFRYGINLVTGFDYYMAKNFFFGYEINVGFAHTINQKVEIKTTGNTTSYPTYFNDFKGSSFGFGPHLMNGVRVGYLF